MTKEYKVKFGDIWKMGKHRLLCGDSTEKVMMDHFLDGYEPKLCITDPPYGINYQSRSNSNSLYELKVKNDHIVNWAEAFRNAKAQTVYIWFSFKCLDIISRAVYDSGYEAKQMVIWVKNHFSLQRYLYHLQHEQCLVCVKPGAMRGNFWKGDRKQRSVWYVDSVKQSKRIHPTEKPVGIYSIPIVNHTSIGDAVLDLFAGSGALFEACEDTKRTGLGVELCPAVCGRILKRMAAKGCSISRERNLFES